MSPFLAANVSPPGSKASLNGSQWQPPPPAGSGHEAAWSPYRHSLSAPPALYPSRSWTRKVLTEISISPYSCFSPTLTSPPRLCNISWSPWQIPIEHDHAVGLHPLDASCREARRVRGVGTTGEDRDAGFEVSTYVMNLRGLVPEIVREKTGSYRIRRVMRWV